ncbi:TetR/AcrR family transcriptional regulator [Sphingobium sufflavum]|uniref:TetR/AcrR family transcriptional regulator n=1 Tax=Sphingobium sufflavum TaxID=1129547 RepID=UPI001F3FD6B9|nr:TetR/AcrR family transcriptional regulator [Sphingobium sufflavum]MCE7796401.1 TetR/AcrR family transcriptional regulator [Sphingobium sufflavum]
MAGVREQAGIERRAAILDEAARLIGEKGFHGFGIQELAQRCGIAKSGFFHHFPSKDRLLIALLQDRDRRDEDAISPRITQFASESRADISASAAALSVFRAMVERNRHQPELVRLYVILRAEALNAAHPAYDYFRRREAEALTFFAKIVAPFADDPHSLARQIMVMMTGLEHQWLREGLAFDLVDEWDRQISRLSLPF